MLRSGSRFALFSQGVAFAATVALPIVAGAQTFNTALTTWTGSPGWFPASHAAVADYNGDGRVDAIISDSGPDLRLMLGNGDGTFSVSPIATPGAGAVVIRSADLNADGRPDVVFGSPQANKAPAVMLNTGNVGGVPQFARTTYAQLNDGIRSITVGDLNADGRPDFLAGGSHGDVRIYLNDGSGAFSVAGTFSIAPGQPAVGFGVVTDLNGDGKNDFAVAASQASATILYLGDGNGGLSNRSELPNNATQLAAADVNGDGKVDLLAGNIGNSGNELLVYSNNGAGSFSGPTAYSTGGTAWHGQHISMALTDVNGDGKIDVTITNSNNHNVAVFMNNGNGSFASPVHIATNQFPTHVSVGDFTGDGRLDIATVGAGGNLYGVLTNTTPAVLQTQTLTILGGVGNFGEVAANVEYFNPATQQWQPVYLVGGHPWGFVPGTNSWINYKPSTASDPGAGPTTNQTRWYLYRVRFTVPADAMNPEMMFSLKADNFAQVAINGVTTGGTTQFINNGLMPNVIVGEANQVNSDGVFSQAVQTGENTITINMGDWGGLNGFNFRIDLKMQSSEPIEIVPVDPDTTAPSIAAPADITVEAESAAGSVVIYNASAIDDIDGPVAVTASHDSGSTFEIGNTTVDLAASDAAGNTATASFTVTVQDTIPPVVAAPASIVAEATSGAGADVAYPPATATDAVGVTSLVSNPPSGSTFPLGATTVTATARDAAGNAGGASFTVTVVDTTAPAVGSVTPSTGSMWPPNHQMVSIGLTIGADDAVGVTGYNVTITSSEPDNGLGDGDTANDFQITGNGSMNPMIQLRSERSGKGNGRTYTIAVVAVDAAGNASAPRIATVSVPKSQGKK